MHSRIATVAAVLAFALASFIARADWGLSAEELRAV